MISLRIHGFYWSGSYRKHLHPYGLSIVSSALASQQQIRFQHFLTARVPTPHCAPKATSHSQLLSHTSLFPFLPQGKLVPTSGPLPGFFLTSSWGGSSPTFWVSAQMSPPRGSLTAPAPVYLSILPAGHVSVLLPWIISTTGEGWSHVQA